MPLHPESPRYKYHTHRQNVRARGIDFSLTFDQWWALWKRSGKWEQRGCHRGQYCMARRGDTGAFEIGNVVICFVEDLHSRRRIQDGLSGTERYRKRHGKSMAYKYRSHRQNALARGIPFRLTFKQWVAIWNGSGKWDQRGWRRGTYCMSRPGDKGAYEVGNVRIILNEQNRAEKNRNYPLLGSDNPAFGKDYWATATRAERKRRAARMSAASLGRPKGKQMRARLSKSTTGRKRVTRNGRVTWAYPGDVDHPGL